MSSFKKRADFFLTSKWVLLFIFFVSMGLLIGFAMTKNVMGLVLFALIGFLTSFFSKNMIVILLISLCLTGVIVGIYPEIGNREGFEEKGETEEDEEETEEDEEEEVVKPVSKKKLLSSSSSKKDFSTQHLEDDNDETKDEILKIYKETMENLVEMTKEGVSNGTMKL